MDGFCLLKKIVDPSVLTYGFTIPMIYQEVFFKQLGFTLAHGETRKIKLLCDEVEYEVKIQNNGFDQRRFDHADILQIRYTEKSPIAIHFRSVFSETVERVKEHYESRTGRERYKTDKENCEYLAVYATPVVGVLMVDCITNQEYHEETAELKTFDELSLENVIDYSASIEVKEGKRKVRKLTKAIGDSLKVVYGYRCQICGQYIGERYGASVIHAHHIDYFVKSLNNNSDNILIVCPNHHAIIHDRNPIFDRKTIQYHYPNGYSEVLVLNKHL